MKNTLWLDMDGTIADLYNHNGWLKLIETEQPVFENLLPICNIDHLTINLKNLIANDFTVGIITWLPANATAQYQINCTIEKLNWTKKYLPFITEFYALPYGTPKQNATFAEETVNYLIDDNAEIIKMWNTEPNHIGILAGNTNINELLQILI
jgi:hypothetical protein